MKVVIADTSPLNYLVLIEEVDLLVRLYGEVLIPDLVVQELADSEAPQVVRQWASHLPSWISVRPTPHSADRIEKLGAGERAAILLAESQTPPVLLPLDDAAGRAEAERRHIPSTGTLGIPRAAAIRKLTDLQPSAGSVRQISAALRRFSTNCWPKMRNATAEMPSQDRSLTVAAQKAAFRFRPDNRPPRPHPDAWTRCGRLCR
jgi:predicted nucleic acid-binding protein